ncbi:hypothetical protein RBH26_17410 [Natronolimnohabitans sp. A-GB9]|uniref:ATP-grasp domain-containing protein n=1 Tax=Natronolimnohabitans sp. A-GB9 TaxID=3069757 RepID=UPI0027B66277|nr:hypothetical protein [Natronolimnohabitans sp. A-GB9]MDQ2052253.1 hypothetical protein [Natronolimnohabitans sp. A-GB9]
MTARIGILTDDSAPELTDDGRAIVTRLERRGFSVEPIVWTDDAVDWDEYDAIVFRSCWDYHTAPERFQSLLAALEGADTVVYNPVSVIEWNVHKSYLFELEAAGVQTVPTVLLEPGDDRTLESVLRDRGWEDAVVKPAIGASSTGVWRTSLEAISRGEQRLEAERSDDVLVQPFLPAIRDGERSIVFVRGEYSHAWNDVPQADEFSAFDETDLSYEPDDSVREAAAATLETACELVGVGSEELAYARVDYLERNGEFVLMELELIEPYLGLDRTENGIERFVEGVTTLLDQSSRL